MRKASIVLIAVSICLALSACMAASPAALTAESPIPDKTSLDQSPPNSTSTVTVTSTLSSTPSLTPSTPRAATNQSTRSPLPPEPCSPLTEHSLAELPEIVSAPYKPPPMGSDARHQGVDFSYYRRGARTSILGAGVRSVFAGRVAGSISDSFPYGNVVIVETPAGDLPPDLAEQLAIQAGQSLYTLYAHMGAAPLVTLGDVVTACQPLGEVGKSGNAGVPHLHLEMRLGPADRQFPSMAFYSTQTTQAERDSYVLWRMSGEFQHFDPMTALTP